MRMLCSADGLVYVHGERGNLARLFVGLTGAYVWSEGG